MPRQHVVVAGASLGGLRAAEQLRAAGFDGDITVVGAEPHMPYNRPPLSKDALREATVGRDGDGAAALAAATALPVRAADDRVRWLLGATITAADLDERRLELADGQQLRYDGLVVATGLRPRRLDQPGVAEAGRHVLRTVEDAAQLSAALVPGADVVIVGGGFIGCELAATASGLGCRVTVVEPLPMPMLRPLGSALAGALHRHHVQAGVTFELGRLVTALHHDRDVLHLVDLDDGRQLPCDVLVEAVGSQPNVEWLAGNGLDLTDGVLCDGWMRVQARSEVVGVGDVARFPSPLGGDVATRVEHWSVPTDTARRAARALAAQLSGAALATPEPMPVPSFWSDQHGLRIQGFGAPGLADDHVVLEGTLETLEDGVAVGAVRGGVLVAVVAVAMPPLVLRRYRDQLGTVHLPGAAPARAA